MSERVQRTYRTDQSGDCHLILDDRFDAPRVAQPIVASAPRADERMKARAEVAWKRNAPALTQDAATPPNAPAKPAITSPTERNDATPDPLARAKAAHTKPGEISRG